jgi:penicillin amidase
MPPVAAKILRLAAAVLGVLLVAALGAGLWFRGHLRSSLPRLDGTAAVPGLGAPVTVERDDLGMPTIRARDRLDATRALGWLHAQDRFFQMDLLRRASAGELAALAGARALPRDRLARRHGFRRLAGQVLAGLTPADRAALEAYAAGANAGLAALGAPPWEYLALRSTPEPWRPEDTLLVGYSLVLDLQDSTGRYERTLMTLRDTYGDDVLPFFAPLVGPDDAALDGSVAPLPPIPGPKLINLRARPLSARPAAPAAGLAWREAPPADPFPFPAPDPELRPGSNAFALAGSLTAGGSALVANDMHLALAVPAIWYRASLAFAGRTLTGVTLPGTPFVVAGSNGDLAWGFTNAQVDSGDLIAVETNSLAPNLYKAPGHGDGFLRLERRRETIAVRGGDPVTEEYEWTVWGPVVGRNHRERPLVLKWVAHDPAAMNLGLLQLEQARTVDEAVASAHRAGISHVNLIVGDRAGAIAWTIAGPLPRRVGYDGRLPSTWSFGDRRWDGYLPAAEVPVLRGGDSSLPGRLWSANQRHVGGAALARLGDGAYATPPRAAQIRDGLARLTAATPRDLLAVQLDDRALFLQPWHARLLAVLTPAAVAGQPARAELRRRAEAWEGRASPEAVSYRLVREFRQAVLRRALGPIFAPCVEAMPDFDSRRLQLEPALQALLRERPLHLLEARYASWDELLTAAADDTAAALAALGSDPAAATWGARNRAAIRHPLSAAIPFVGRWLDLPADPLPGDSDLPRYQSPAHGASERLVVAPGREAEGILQVPGGQSGHPLSPYYRAGHAAWVRGEPSPLLPGPTRHTLTLQP